MFVFFLSSPPLVRAPFNYFSRWAAVSLLCVCVPAAARAVYYIYTPYDGDAACAARHVVAVPMPDSR